MKNEFSVCFALQQYQNEDLQLVLETNKIYGKSQKALIYINGNIAGNLEFSNRIFEYEITIPNEYIKTDEIVLRIVFPGAVTPRMLDQTQNDDYRQRKRMDDNRDDTGKKTWKHYSHYHCWSSSGFIHDDDLSLQYFSFQLQDEL